MGMISRRLTKPQKAQILEAYKAGDNTNYLAEKYSCTANTINRTVKTLLSDNEYKLLKEKRSKLINKKLKIVDDKIVNEKEKDLPIESDEELNNHKVEKISALAVEDTYAFSENLYSEKKYDNNFELIEPLISDFDFDKDKKKKDFEILDFDSLPESVYMIVDKKVELDSQLISDLPEWIFLPEDELKRNAILLFYNQRSAKRNCSRSQRCIKIPNTNVFEVSKSYLVSNGITRLILEDSIIALDN